MKIYVKNTQAVFGFATKRADLADSLESNVREIIKHLIKLWIYPEDVNVHHWKQEIYNFLHKVPKLRGSKKYPTEAFILKNTIDVNYKDIDHLVYIVMSNHMNKQILIYDVSDEMKESIVEYFEWLAKNLSTYGEVSRVDLYNKLKRLGFGAY